MMIDVVITVALRPCLASFPPQKLFNTPRVWLWARTWIVLSDTFGISLFNDPFFRFGFQDATPTTVFWTFDHSDDALCDIDRLQCSLQTLMILRLFGNLVFSVFPQWTLHHSWQDTDDFNTFLDISLA